MGAILKSRARQGAAHVLLFTCRQAIARKKLCRAAAPRKPPDRNCTKAAQLSAGFTNQYRLDSGMAIRRGTGRDWRFEFREDVGDLTPFSFGRPWTGETVKNLCRPPGSTPSVRW